MSEIFFLWGAIENEDSRQERDKVREELEILGHSEDYIEEYLNEIGL